MHNTEDKKWWVEHGRKKEDDFVEKVAPFLGLNAIINPEKKTNPYKPDLIVNKNISDLKFQEEPFFKSQILYNVDNQYAVTFNHKDYISYNKNYPNIDIYFWVDWKTKSRKIGNITYEVRPMKGIWKARFQILKNKIVEKETNLHSYTRRVDDTEGNGKASYVLDVRWFENLFLRLK